MWIWIREFRCPNQECQAFASAACQIADSAEESSTESPADQKSGLDPVSLVG